MSEIQTLHRRWSKADDGNLMPEEIAAQSIELIRKAVGWREKGITVAVPKITAMVAEVAEESLMDWDRQDDKNGNAYA